MNESKLDRFRESEALFRCPICGGELHVDGGSFVCEARHCFDFARQGYVNLMPKQKGRGAYSKESFENRNFVLENGFYEPILRAIEEKLLQDESLQNVLDVGCGEGFYSRRLAESTARKFFAFDISKEAVALAAKLDAANAVRWFVGDLFRIPLKNGVFDCILDVFTPANYAEFRRVLRPGGLVVKVVPTSGHLRELRALVGDRLQNPEYSNNSVLEVFGENMKLLTRETVSSTTRLTPEQRSAFVDMTPLLFSVEKSTLDLEPLVELTVEAEILVGTFEP